jgi:hypothetical protein
MERFSIRIMVHDRFLERGAAFRERGAAFRALVNEVDNFCKYCGVPRQGLRRT